jgi:S1-C subfamily serine protease
MMINNRRNLVTALGWIAVFVVIASIAITCQACMVPPQAPTRPGTPRAPTAQAAAAVEVDSHCNLELLDEVLVDTYWSGSGVQIDRERVLTAQHVVRCPAIPTVRIVYADGHSRAMRVEREDPDSDLALLVTASAEDLPDLGVPEIGPKPGPGAMLCSATAYPKAGWACGDVDAVHDGDKWDLEDPGLVVPGNSGSGVYDAEGRLVAIVSAGSWCDGDHHEDGFCGRITTSLAAHRRKLGF